MIYIKNHTGEPSHLYTKILLSSLPSVHGEDKEIIRFADTLSGATDACVFYEKCPYRKEKCFEAPPFEEFKENHGSACHFKEVNINVSRRTSS